MKPLPEALLMVIPSSISCSCCCVNSHTYHKWEILVWNNSTHIRQVLQDLEEQERVTEAIRPILSIQLVLNVPELPRPASKESTTKRRNSRRFSVVPIDATKRRRSLIHATVEVKKAVKFTDEQESSGKRFSSFNSFRPIDTV